MCVCGGGYSLELCYIDESCIHLCQVKDTLQSGSCVKFGMKLQNTEQKYRFKAVWTCMGVIRIFEDVCKACSIIL